MILSRFCRHLSPVLLGLGGSFCFSKIKNFDILGYQKLKKIQKIGSIDIIFKSAKEEKDGMTAKVLVEYSAKALKLLQIKNRINFSDAIEFIKQIGNSDLKQIGREDLLILLKFINRVEVKLVKYHYSVAQTKMVLSEKLKEILERQQKFKTVEDMEELIQFYLYYADDRFAVLNKILIPSILTIAHELLRQKQLTVSYKSITNFMIGASRRELLTPYERTMRSIFMAKLKEQAQQIPISELAKLCIELNVMDHFDMDFNDQETISILFQRLSTLVPNLLETQIKNIFHVSSNTDNLVTLLPVYREILHFLFDRIRKDGSSDIAQFFIIDIFQHSSRKIKFNKHLDKQEQNKLFAFMNHYISKHNDDKSKGIFNNALKNMITDRMFNVQDQKINLEGLLSHIKDKVTIPLLYALQSHGYEVQRLLDSNAYDISGEKLEYIVKYSIVLRKVLNINQNHQIGKAVEPVYAVLSQYFASEDSFSNFMMQIYTLDFTGSLLGQFCDLYPQLFNRLKNPFEVNPFNNNYAISYLDFIYKTKHKKQTWVKNFQKTSENKITQDLLLTWINRQLRYKRQNIEPHRQFIRFFQKNIENFIFKKHGKFLKNFLILMAKYLRDLVNNKLQQNVEESVWKIVQILIKNKQIFAQLNLNGDLSIFLHPFLCKYRNYHHKHNYKQFVGIVFKNLDYFKNKITFQADFTKESFRMNLVNKENVHVITSEIKKRLLPQEYMKYRTLTEHNFVPEIKDKDKIDLDVLVYNSHTQNILQEYLAVIENAIPNYSLSRLENILVNFNQPTTKTNLQIFKMILAVIKLKVSQFETFNALGVFQAINSHQLCQISEAKDIFQKMMNFYQNSRSKFFSLDCQSIIEIIKYTAAHEANSLPLLAQFQGLVSDWLRTSSNVSKCAVILHLLNTSFVFKAEHLTFLLKMIEINYKIATRFFLFLEDSYSDRSKGQIVSLLAPKIKAAKPQDQIFDWFYIYLKGKYPSEMKDVTLVPSLLPEYRFSFKPAPPILQFLQKISQTLKLDLKPLDSLGENAVYQFNERIIIFGRMMSDYQTGFIKKAIKATKKIDLPLVLLCSPDKSALLLEQTNLLTKEQIQQLTDDKHYQEYCKTDEGEKPSKEETAL